MFKLLHKTLLAILFTAFASQASAMWIQADWLDPTQPGVGTNRYAYSANDPINKFDPKGNSWLDRAWDGVAGEGSFNRTFGDSGSAWSDRNFGSGGERVTSSFYSGGAAKGTSYTDYKSKALDKNQAISNIIDQDAIARSNIDIDIALTATGVGPAYRSLRGGYAALQAARALAVEKVAMAAAANAPFKSTALTAAGRALSKHPNIAGFETGAELSRAFRTPQALNDAAAKAVSEIMSNGARVARNHNRFGSIVEYKMSNGIGVRFSASTNELIGFLGR